MKRLVFPPRSAILLAVVCLAVFWTLVTGASFVQAQQPDPDSQAHDIAKKLNCPVCAGLSLADCQTDTCMQWKQEIKTQVEDGKTSQQIIDYFQTRFGPTVLQEPPKQGVVLVLWILPVLLLVAVLIAVVIALRRSIKPKLPLAPSSPGGAPADEYVAKFEEQVGKP